MAEKRSLFSQLTSVGEDAFGKLTQNPVTHKALEGAVQVKDRVEKMVGSLTELEGRVAKLEKRVDALDKPKRAPAKKASTAKSSASKSSGSSES